MQPRDTEPSAPGRCEAFEEVGLCPPAVTVLRGSLVTGLPAAVALSQIEEANAAPDRRL
jgi:hypothetical protein